MKVKIVGRFSLSDEPAASCYSQPVLLDSEDGVAYDPDDPIPWCNKPTARDFVQAVLKTKQRLQLDPGFSEEEWAFIKRFINLETTNLNKSVH